MKREEAMRTTVLLALAALLVGTQAMAKDISFGTTTLGQGEFRSLSKEAGAAIGYRNTAPAEPLGTTGFDAGVEVSAVDIKSDSAYWRAAFGNDAPSYLVLPKVRVRKGLPFGIDVGAMYSFLPDSNVKLYGFEVRRRSSTGPWQRLPSAYAAPIRALPGSTISTCRRPAWTPR
jgi:hypothetical protein